MCFGERERERERESAQKNAPKIPNIENCVWKTLSSNWISGGVGFEYQFFVKDIGFGFPINLLIWGKSFPKIFVAETEETVSESIKRNPKI